MPKNAYITTLGRSVWALINTYYAVLRDKNYLPDRVYVFTERTYEPELKNSLAAVNILNDEFGISPEVKTEIVSDVDFYKATHKIFKIVKSLKDEGFRVAIDITPGRKALVVATIIPASKVGVDHVFYLSITSTDNAAKPYMMIPLQIQHIRDFIKDKGEVAE